MSSNDPSSASNTTSSPDKSLQRSQTLPLTTTVVEIVGQVPEPLSPSDKKSAEAADNSLDAALQQQKQEAEQHEIVADSTETSPSKGISLPLPASSALADPEPSFPRPLRSQTVPASAISATAQEEPVSPQQAISSSKTFPVTTSEPTETMSGQQPIIAELPGTPVSHHIPDAETKKLDEQISLEQSARLKATKSEDAAVIYDIPVTPSAQAFEVANKNNIGKGYFDPIFPAAGGEQEKKVEAPKVEAA